MRTCAYCKDEIKRPRSKYCSIKCGQRAAYHRNPEYYKKAVRRWAVANPEKCKEYNKRFEANNPHWVRAGILRRHGLTIQDYERMLAAQDYKCAACKTEKPGKGRTYFDVDHCHETGKVRGLLCIGCNRGLGFLGDDPARVSAVLQYLTERD
jgi:hypothetical protein